MSDQLLVMLVGTMGAGKSTFSRQLAERIGAVRVNGDTIRQQLFKDYDEWSRPENKTKIDEILEAQVRRALEAGQSVIRDHRHGSRAKRNESRRMAAECGARSVVAWVQTPVEIAIKRTVARPQASDSIKFEPGFN